MQYKLIKNSLNDTKNIIKTILQNRKIKDGEHYLYLTENDVEPYTHLDNIEQAVKCFVEYFERGDVIGVLMDTDT